MNSQLQDPLAPGLRQFVDQLSRDYKKFPPFSSLPVVEQRRVAGKVREPWAEGGPTMALTRDISFDSPTGTIRARLHLPHTDTDGPLPIFIYAHGGGWVIFDLDTHDRLMREYAARSGVAVIGLDYSPAPEARYPRQIDECCELVKWLHRGEIDGIDPSRIAVGGDSAGANLALAVALRLRDEPGAAHQLQGVIMNYGAFDPHCGSESYQTYAAGEYLLAGPEMRGFWETYVRDEKDFDDPLVDLLKARLEGLPPCLLSVAEHDVLRDENLTMADALRQAGVDTQIKLYPGAIHSFLEAVSVAPISAEALDDAARWINLHLAPKA